MAYDKYFHPRSYEGKGSVNFFSVPNMKGKKSEKV